MLKTQRKTFTALSLAAAAALSLAACSTGASTSGSTGAASSAPSSSASESTTSESPMASESADTMDPAANLVGAGCAEYAKAVPDGDGSVAGMAVDPVAVAASNNPLLKTLTAAVSGELNPKVDLVDTLNSSEFTVFAPVDSAFAKIPAATIETLKTDDKTLSSILTYHVVPGQLDPEQVVGEQESVQGGAVKVTGSGDNLMVNDAKVICGGVKTANATVYLIDSVLMPPAAK